MAEPLPHAERVGAVPLGRRGQQADPVERGVDAARGGRAGRRAVGGVEPEQVVAPGQVRVEGRPLDERPDRAAAPRPARLGIGARRAACSCRPSGRTRPSSIRMVVVLPDPFGPRNP